MFDYICVSDWLPNFTVFFLYAEIHYKILKLPSRLFHRWPEILADIPCRIEPGKKIPILLMAKDANRYPVQLKKVRIEIRNAKNLIRQIEILKNPIFINSDWWDQIIEIENPAEGEIWIDVYFTVTKRNRTKIFKNNNYRRSSNLSFKIYSASDNFPAFPNQYFGDIHCHSNYTSDQVEFGAPLTAIKTISQAVGLSFVAVTDHSYDLDDLSDNFLKNDPKLQKWRKFQNEIAGLNQDQGKNPVYLIPGEEVSVANHTGRNVHFLVLNCTKFYEGYGDSAEKWFRTRATWNIKNLLDDLPKDAIAILPHPFISVPLLEYIFLRRGNIKRSDYRHERLHGLQILNSHKNQAFYRGLEIWKKQLLRGKRVLIYAGNDSHGNFNHYRQVKIPHCSLIEKDVYLFGRVKTAIIVKDKLNLSEIGNALRDGRCYITEGPALNFTAMDENNNVFETGQWLFSNSCQFNISVLSTSEFGRIKRLTIFWGSLVENQETVYKNIKVDELSLKNFIFSCSMKEKSYFRIEVETERGGTIYNAYSNPIWAEPQRET